MQNAATERQPAEHPLSPGSLLYVLYVLYLTRQATEHPEDPRELAIQAIHAASSPRAELGTTIKARPQIKARPKIRTWPPLPRIPHPNAARVFPKPSTQGYTYISGPTPASWGADRTRTRSTRGPTADQVTQQPAAPAQAPPAPSRVIGQGRPLTLFFPVPPKALPAAVPPKHSAAAAPPAPAAGYPQPVPKPGSSRRTHAPTRR